MNQSRPPGGIWKAHSSDPLRTVQTTTKKSAGSRPQVFAIACVWQFFWLAPPSLTTAWKFQLAQGRDIAWCRSRCVAGDLDLRLTRYIHAKVAAVVMVLIFVALLWCKRPFCVGMGLGMAADGDCAGGRG